MLWILKLQVLPWHLWASQDPKGSTMNFPALTRHDIPAPVGKGTQPASSLISWTSCTPSNHLSKLFYLPAGQQIIQTSQPHPLPGARGLLTFLLVQSVHLNTPPATLCSWVQPICGSAWHMVSSSLDCEWNCIILWVEIWICSKIITTREFSWWS